MTLLTVESLSVNIPTAQGMARPVRDVSLTVARGETLCVVGESGCGKSLTALAIMGLLPRRAVRAAAALHFDGQDLLQLSPRAMNRLRGNRLALVLQDSTAALNPCLTIGLQLTEVYLRHKGGPKRNARDRAVELLEICGVSSAASRMAQYPHQLSGGLRQRVVIASAMMCDPDLIIADEPTTALDVTVQAQILRLLVELRQRLGMALIHVTHDLGIVSRLANRVAVMYAGQIVESGPVEAVFSSPHHPYTQALLGCTPDPGRTAHAGRLPTIPGLVPAATHALDRCLFANRCNRADAECRSSVIPLTEADYGRQYRCRRPLNLPAMAVQ